METRQRVTRTVRAFVIAAAILGGGVQVLASQEERAHKVEGAWRTVVTITDCAPAGAGAYQSLRIP